MKKDITKKVVTIMFLSVATVLLVLGFVAVKKLSLIDYGSKNTKYSLYFDKESLNETTTGKTLTDKDNTSISGTNITGRIALKEKGDSVIYTWDIINGGTVDAELKELPVILGLNSNDKQAITYDLEINNQKAEVGTIIRRGEVANAKLVIRYKNDSPTLIDQSTVQVVSVTLQFNQK